MDFAFALFRYFPYGGLQRDMRAIAEAMLARGHSVTVYTRHWQGEIPEGLGVHTLPVRGGTNHGRDRRMARLLRDHAGAHERVVGFNKMPGLDFYYAADSCLAARYARHPARWLPRYHERLAQEAAVFRPEAATRILSISPPQKRLYQAYYGTPEHRFHELPPGIRRDRIVPTDYDARRAAHRKAHGIASDEPVLLFVGSGFRTKGLDRALRALAALEDERARLWVIGRDKAGPYRRLARRLGIAGRVRFLGGRDDIPAWLWAADVLLHPAYAENTGTVLLEAAVAGLPVVTTDTCGYSPWIEHADMGRVIGADEVTDTALKQALEAVLAAERSRWVERGRHFAETADIFDLVEHAVDGITQAPA